MKSVDKQESRGERSSRRRHFISMRRPIMIMGSLALAAILIGTAVIFIGLHTGNAKIIFFGQIYLVVAVLLLLLRSLANAYDRYRKRKYYKL